MMLYIINKYKSAYIKQTFHYLTIKNYFTSCLLDMNRHQHDTIVSCHTTDGVFIQKQKNETLNDIHFNQSISDITLQKWPSPLLTRSTAELILTDFAYSTPSGLLDATLRFLHKPTQLMTDSTHDSFEEQLTGLQWIGFLSQHVRRFGPTGRFVVTQFLLHAPKWWNLTFTQTAQHHHIYHLDSTHIEHQFLKGIDKASQLISGRDWREDKLLLIRRLYPIQVYRLLEIDVEDIQIKELFNITQLEASELPSIATTFFDILSGKKGKVPLSARFQLTPLTMYHSAFHQIKDMAQQYYHEHALNCMEAEGTNPLHLLKFILKKREEYRQLTSIHRFLASPSPLQRINVKHIKKRLMPSFPDSLYFKTIKLSNKLKLQLLKDAELFLEIIGQKLLSLVLLHCLPQMREQQIYIDCQGDPIIQKALLHTSHRLPPISAVQCAFNFNLKNRNDSLVFMTPDNIWRMKYLKQYIGTSQSFFNKHVLPEFEEFQKILLENVPMPSRPYLAYLAFCDSPDAHLIDYWWTGEHTQDDVDVQWRTNGVMTSKEFSEYEWGPSLRQPLSICLTQDLIQEIYQYLKRTTEQFKSNCQQINILVIGNGASKLSWFLKQQQQTYGNKQDNVCRYIPAAVMPPSYCKDGLINSFNSSKISKNKTKEIKQAEDTNLFELNPTRYPYIFEFTGAIGFPYDDANTLDRLLELYTPTVILCLCMPSGVDWTAAFRQCKHLKEYILLGPRDSDISGHPFDTWGQRTFFDKPRLIQTSRMIFDFHETPPFSLEGFYRYNIPEISSQLLGSLDTPGQSYCILCNYFSYL